MRRLYRRLALLYLVSALLFVLIFGVLLYLRGRKENEEYVTHAWETAYILENDPKAAEPSALEAFRELLGVGAVSLPGTDGKILVSTEEELVGTREEEQVMAELLTSPRDEGAVVQVDEPDFWEQPACFYVAVPVESPGSRRFVWTGTWRNWGCQAAPSGCRRFSDRLPRNMIPASLQPGRPGGWSSGSRKTTGRTLRSAPSRKGGNCWIILKACP